MKFPQEISLWIGEGEKIQNLWNIYGLNSLAVLYKAIKCTEL